MHRRWICIFCVALLIAMIGGDVASAKKSRSSHAASRAHAKREARASRTSRTSRAKGGAKLSRRESSRRDKRGRGKVAKAGKRSRYVASSRRGSRRGYVTEARATESAAPRPASGGIPSERATEIQKALIKAGYMDGPPSGQYDDATIQAMKQYQSANGLPQTGLPSAPLLKKLGVPKRSGDGYAVPVNTVSETEKKRPTQ
jgi:hypothetical protein